MSDEVTDIRLMDLKEIIVKIRLANNNHNNILVDSLCMIAATQLKSLEHNLKAQPATKIDGLRDALEAYTDPFTEEFPVSKMAIIIKAARAQLAAQEGGDG